MKEGSAASDFLRIIKNQGYNKDCYVHVGVVNGSKIKVGDFELDADDYILCESLSKHIRSYKNIATGDTMNFEVQKQLKSGEKVLIIQDGAYFYAIDRVVT